MGAFRTVRAPAWLVEVLGSSRRYLGGPSACVVIFVVSLSEEPGSLLVAAAIHGLSNQCRLLFVMGRILHHPTVVVIHPLAERDWLISLYRDADPVRLSLLLVIGAIFVGH